MKISLFVFVVVVPICVKSMGIKFRLYGMAVTSIDFWHQVLWVQIIIQLLTMHEWQISKQFKIFISSFFK